MSDSSGDDDTEKGSRRDAGAPRGRGPQGRPRGAGGDGRGGPREGDRPQRRQGGAERTGGAPRRDGDFRPKRGDGGSPRGDGRYAPREGRGYPARDERGSRPRGDAEGRPRRDGGSAPREGGYRPRDGAEGRPQRDRGFAPRRQEGSRPRRDGEARPQRDGGFTSGREGGYRPRRDGEGRPERGGFAPRRNGDSVPRQGGGSRPRRDGEFPPRGDGRPAPRDGERRLWTRDGKPARGDRSAARPERDGERQRPRELTPVRPRHDDPEIPESVTARDLDGAARLELRTLAKDNADEVARHLVMAARLIDEDPELAHRHALSASRRAGRVGVVRETLAITAYATGDFALALRELRTYRRISGKDDQLPLMVDSERGVGRPERALELGRSVERSALSSEVQASLAIAMSGARLDLHQPELALAELQIPQLNPDLAYSWSPALFRAYGDVLEELGRGAEAQQWWDRADRAAEALDEAAAEGELETVEVTVEDVEDVESDEPAGTNETAEEAEDSDGDLPEQD